MLHNAYINLLTVIAHAQQLQSDIDHIVHG